MNRPTTTTATRLALPLFAAGILATLASCGNGSQSENTVGGNDGTAATVPAAFLVDTAPEGARDIVAARAVVKPGDAIVLRGRVGGKAKPISDAGAVFVLADNKAMTACDARPDDPCTTPWDYCCDAPKIAASTATIQAKDADGKILRATFRGLGGLKEHSSLVVAGTVDEASTPEALIVDATSIYVETP